jgi:hypothetical protein
MIPVLSKEYIKIALFVINLTFKYLNLDLAKKLF